MKTTTTLFCVIALMVLSSFSTNNTKTNSKLYPAIVQYIQSAEKDFDKIPADRKLQLKKVALFIQTKLSSEKKVDLIYICTHNSRRSHTGQLWALAAAEYYGIKGVSAYSGGLEITAFNANAVKALNDAGFKITKKSDGTNPNFESRFSDGIAPVISFSKKYMDKPNPTTNFAAIMTCAHADKTCPIVAGASIKISTPYEDPKEADGTPQQDQVYKERCKQIATEVLYSFSLVKRPAGV
jgi:protein-tyrosine phosphatase/arsenate reductase